MHRRFWIPVVLAAVVLSLPGLAAAELCFNATIDGIQSGTGSSGTGTGKFVLNDDETVLTYKVNFTGLGSTETAAHIHSDAEAGGVVKNLGTGAVKVGQWTSTDTPPLNAARVADLKAGLMYVNIHSINFPAGEIQGQMLVAPCEEQCFEAAIDGALVGEPGTGFARVALNHSETELAYWVEFSGLSTTETAAHIHSNAEGGAVVRSLGTGTPKAGVWKFNDTPGLTAQRVKDLKTGFMYVNIHSINYPAGELSGDIVAGTCEPQCFVADLDGPQAGTSSTATGHGYLHLSHAHERLEYSMTIASFVNETAAHIHNENEADGVVENIGVGQSVRGDWDYDDTPPLSLARVLDLKAAAMYMNVHSTSFPAGEIRGQLNPIVCSATGVGDTPRGVTSLAQNYPNPFNPSTTIAFTLARAGRARVDVYDVAGRRVATLIDGVAPAGRHEVVWDGRDARGNPVASGLYFYRLVAGRVAETRRMVLLK